MKTATVGLAVTPTVVSTFFSHLFNRKHLAHKPTAHLSYHEGLRVIRAFLDYASRHTVEELQAFTSQWVPHPQWVKVDKVEIPETDLSRAAELLIEQLGPDGIRQVGGREWWQWRRPKSPLKAEWIEMKGDYQRRKKKAGGGNRVMLYVHGGAYFFGSVDEHRYQIQRHARKLKARALAPRYRLAPQFPFPCGLQDCLATYLFLISQQEPSTVILAGDSAGAGMILSMMVILRDRGIPLPAGAVLISPWVDLTHSFPSVAGDAPLDYIPPSGFHHKPSPAWPPPDEAELEELKKVAMAQKKEIEGQDGQPSDESGVPTVKDVADTTHSLTFLIDGEQVEVTEQIQMYTTNELVTHPLVSPVLQATLGGLPPLLIMVGGGELLRDEQIYLAHKCANPAGYLPPETLLDDRARELIERYKPTDVQLQVWDDMCHVGPTLSFTKPAKYMYRSIAQFSTWALARAQKTDVDTANDDDISVISENSSAARSEESDQTRDAQAAASSDQKPKHHTSVGRAGDPLPAFEDHMIRQRVTRHGVIHPLPPPAELPGCCMPRDLVGVVKVGTVRKWYERKKRRDARFRKTKARVHKARLRDMAAGYEVFGPGEVPPPSALAGRRKLGAEPAKQKEKKKARGFGMAMWALWGSKHDEVAVQREEGAAKASRPGTAAGLEQGQGARHFSDLERQVRETRGRERGASSPPPPPPSVSAPAVEADKERAWDDLVKRNEARSKDAAPGEEAGLDLRPARPVPVGSSNTIGAEEEERAAEPSTTDLAPGGGPVETGVTGKRAMLGGLATPFSLRREPETASMLTLAPPPTERGSVRLSTADADADSGNFVAAPEERAPAGETADGAGEERSGAQEAATPGTATPFLTPVLSPVSPSGRPEMERFVTADELPKVSG